MASSHDLVTDATRIKHLIDLTPEELARIQEDITLLFSPSNDPMEMSKEVRMKAEEELGEHPEIMRMNLEALKMLLEDDEHLNARLDDIFLAAFLRWKKHDVDKAFQSVRNYYEFKARYPEHYSYALPSEMPEVFSQQHFGSIAGYDRKGRKICAFKPGKMNMEINIPDSFKLGTSCLELMLSDPELQVAGTVLILDLGDFTILQQAKLITPTVAWHVTVIIQDKIPLRLKAIHIVNQPLYFNAFYAIFKPFLKKKLKKRIFLHGKDRSSLHEHISPEYLPEEWGGSRPSFNGNLTRVLLQLNEHKFKEWAQYNLKKYN